MSRVLSTWVVNWAEDSAVSGAAKIAMGLAFVLSGVLGLYSDAEWTTEFDAFFGMMLFGGLFFGAGFWMRPKPFKDEIKIQGMIVDMSSYRSSPSGGRTGKTMLRPIYGYEVNGNVYRVECSTSSTSPPDIGKPVMIGYSASNPESGRRIDGVNGAMFLLVHGLGLGVMLRGGWQLMGPYALIVAGIVALVWGYKDRSSAETKLGCFRDLFSLISKETLMYDGASLNALMVGDVRVLSSGSTEAAQSPAGWMQDPENSSQMRWWDGTAWTDMFQPVSSAQSEQAVVAKQPERGESSDLTDTDGW